MGGSLERGHGAAPTASKRPHGKESTVAPYQLPLQAVKKAVIRARPGIRCPGGDPRDPRLVENWSEDSVLRHARALR